MIQNRLGYRLVRYVGYHKPQPAHKRIRKWKDTTKHAIYFFVHHQKYIFRPAGLEHDIAVIFLEGNGISGVDQKDMPSISPAPLKDLWDSPLALFGYGSTEKDVTSDDLLAMLGYIYYKPAENVPTWCDNRVKYYCITGSIWKQHPKYGDSGGPVVIHRKRPEDFSTESVLVGIITGHTNISELNGNELAVATNVAYYFKWIEFVTKEIDTTRLPRSLGKDRLAACCRQMND